MGHRHRLARYAAALALFPAFAWPQGAGAGAPGVERPRLVVMVAVDQMIPEQLERLGPLLQGGLGRFVHQGTVYARAHLQYADTETGPGHASYGTGQNPVHHGVVGNDWVLPEDKAPTYCVSDPDARLVTAQGPTSKASMSPRNIRAPGLIDRLKALDPACKGFAVSIKDRAAVAMSGQRPELALWWNRTSGGFVTSTWYAPSMPAWLIEFDAQWLASFQKTWGAGWHPLDVPLDGTDTAADDARGELPYHERQVFPYPAPVLSKVPTNEELAEVAAVVYGSPAGDQLVCELARKAVGALELGRDEHVDVLYVSLSACDTVGHSFGPRSREVTDVLLRADLQLGRLFDELDAQVGRGRWIASLSADHGVMDLPEALLARGIGAERVPSKVVSTSVKAMRKQVEEQFGEDFYLHYDSRGVRLSWTRIQAAGHRLSDVRAFAARALEVEAEAWLERAWTWDELEAVARRGEAAQGWKRSWANSFDEERTQDVMFQPKPWKLLSVGLGTTHGTLYPYDTRVPLAFYGPGFTPGVRYEPASSIDAVPTLMAALGCKLPSDFDGRVLPAR